MTLVDAGPLVAILHADDQHHAWCVNALRRLTGPIATVWPPLVEAMYLLSFSGQAQDALWSRVQAGALRLLPLDERDVPRMRVLMDKYRDLPMDLADASIVRVAERERIDTVFTVDRRDFGLYRPEGIGRFTLVE